MKKYIKNKKFIPYGIYEKSETINKKINFRLFIIFILIDCFLFSMNLKEKSLISDKRDMLLKLQIEKENTSVNLTEIIDNCDELLSDYILESELTNEGGSVKLKSFEEVNKFSQNSKYSITDIECDENNNYKVSFYLNE